MQFHQLDLCMEPVCYPAPILCYQNLMTAPTFPLTDEYLYM